MIEFPLSPTNPELSNLLAQAATDDVVLISGGKPVGVLIGFANEDDWFDYQLENDPRFLKRIERSRSEAAAGKVVRLEDLAE